MARAKVTEAILDSTGTPVTGASVQVNLRASSAATLYAAESGGTTVANPATTTSGRIDAWVDEGSYDLVVTYAGSTATYPFEAKKGFSSTDTMTVGTITFGAAGDTNLYRSAANTLKTDDALVVTGTLTTTGGLSTPRGWANFINAATQSIPNTTWTALSFSTGLAPMFSGASPTRLTVQTPGYYFCSINIGFAANATGYRGARILINGSTTQMIAMDTRTSVGASDPTYVTAVGGGIFLLNQNDYLTAEVYQSSGGALSTVSPGATTTNSSPTNFSAVLLSST